MQIPLPFSRWPSPCHPGIGRALATLLLGGLFLSGTKGQTDSVYYVAPNGSDTAGDGTAAAPWATISAAVLKVPETGGTILVRDGLYRGNVRISRKFRGLLVVRAENPYRAQLRHDDNQTLSIWDAANVVVSGFDIARGKYPTSSPLCAQIARAESIALIDNIIHDSYNNDVLKMNEAPRNILVMGNVFYNMEGSAGQHIDVNGATDVTIRDNIFFNDYSDSPYDGKDTHGFIVVKNSGGIPEARRTYITSNVFLNWVGGAGSNFVLFAEDAQPFYEYQDAVVENNLMIGNSAERMRSPFSSKGAKDVVFRNNTITGDLPSSAYAVRFTQGGPGIMNKNFRLLNNIWSDPTGTMLNFADGFREEAVNLVLDNNLYWNGGEPIPLGRTPDKGSAQYTDDERAIVADPRLPPAENVVLPRWTGESFRSGAKTIREEFERLVRLYGTPDSSSPATGASDPGNSPLRDILDRARGPRPDLGAVQVDAPAVEFRIVPVPQRLTGGMGSTLSQVVLNEPAGADGVTVNLSSTEPDLMTVPESIYVPAGAMQATFRLDTSAVDETRQVEIAAAIGERRSAAALTLTPAGINDVSLSPETLTAGADTSTRNIVYLDGVAGEEGLTVALSSSNPEIVSVPEWVKIAPGKSYSEFFPVKTRFVAERTPVTVTAAAGSSSASAVLTLTPPSMKLILRNDAVAGEQMLGPNRVILDSPAPEEGGSVALTSSDPEILKVPETIPVAAGEVIAQFMAEVGAATARTNLTVSASYGGKTVTVPCIVVPLQPIRLTPPGPLPSGGKISVGMSLNGTPLKDTTVEVAVPADAPLIVPSSVVVPAGNWGTYIPVEARSIQSNTSTKLTVSYREASVSANLELIAARLKSIALAVKTLVSGLSFTSNTVNLNGAAPEGGKVVRLASSHPQVVSVPESVVIPAGATSARFSIAAVPVAESTTVTITAICDDVTLTATLPVVPPDVSYLGFPNPMAGGTRSTDGTLYVNGLAPPGGTRIRLSSSDITIVTVSESAIVPEGKNRATYEIVTNRVAAPVDVTITASTAGASISKTMSVLPPFVTGISFSATTVTGGDGPHMGRVYLPITAPEEGVAVALVSSAPDILMVPDSVMIVGGTSSATFTYTTKPVTAETKVTVTATGGGVSRSGTVTVKP